MKTILKNISKMLIVVGTMTAGNAMAQVTTNYVKSFVARESIKSGIKGVNDSEKVGESYQFYDGIGRAGQQIAIETSPNNKDIVSGVYFDAFGRADTSYLPYTHVTNGHLQTKSEFLEDQQTFYSGSQNYAVDTHPFAVSIFDVSPLNRNIEQGAPGSEWQPGTGNSVITRYGLNGSQEVKRLDFKKGSIVTPTEWWGEGVLTKVTTLDEDRHEMIEYSNKLGQVVLKRSKLQGENVDTHYLYDDKGNLVRVIQPEGSKMIGTQSMSVILERFAFQYEFDARNRMVSKKVPGAEKVLMVYDEYDRLVLTQDGNQRLREEWVFTKYDQLNRPIMTGLMSGGSKDAVKLIQHRSEQFDLNGAYLYTNNAYPITDVIEVFTVTFYDNYDFMQHEDWVSADLNFKDMEGIPEMNTEVRGQTTGTMVKVEDGSWIRIVTYFDRKYRVIQTQSTNHLGGKDVVTNEYDFIGQMVKGVMEHSDGTNTTTIKRNFKYDKGGRLEEVWHQINDENPILLSENNYNELGELMEKNLHGGEQSLDYKYNIRGWMTSINDHSLSDGEGDLFGMELLYNKVDNGLSNKSLKNGNISGIKWSDYNSHTVNSRAYAYTYDDMNRLLEADHFENGSATNKYDVDGIKYDQNGNIEALKRHDLNGGKLDELVYSYGSHGNKLQYVSDDSGNDDGFDDGSSVNTLSNPDYTYDENGNMVSDQNKAITSISYNHLNLPTRVEFENGDHVEYLYDALGTKLRKSVHKAGGTPSLTSTDYVGEFIYENSALQLIQQEEGRVIPFHENGSGTKYDYQYHLKDHLGNVRMTFKTTPVAYRTVENMESDHPEGISAFVNIPHQTNISANTTEGGDEVAALGPGQVGAMVMFRVHKGDTVKLSVNSNYESTINSFDFVSVLSDALLSAYNSGTSGTAMESLPGGVQNEISNALDDMVTLSGSKVSNDDAPRAYINYIYFNSDLSYHRAGYTQISTDANGVGAKEEIVLDVGTIEKDGRILAYLSNESHQPITVNFDDFTIQHTARISVIQNDDYYPFGLTFNSSVDEDENLYKYNGKEEQKETKWLDYGARMYDPALGRFFTHDRFAVNYMDHSPYHYVMNNPINSIDINGDSTVVIVHGDASETYTATATGESFLLYDVSVYTDMTLDQYNDHVANGTLPDASYTTKFARDAHDVTKGGESVEHSAERYGTNNETPAGTYYLFKPGTNGDPGGGSYDLYVGDSNGSRTINGPDGERKGIAFHEWDPRDSQGCFTSCTGSDTSPITNLMNAIPDLNDDTQPVRLIVQPRDVSVSQWSNSANGTNKYKGTAAQYAAPTMQGVVIQGQNESIFPLQRKGIN